VSVIENFLAMDGHGAFVWPAYGFAFLVLGGLLLWSLRELRSHERSLHKLRPQDPDAA